MSDTVFALATASRRTRRASAVVVQEPPVPAGIPDLVLWEIDEALLGARLAAPYSPILRERLLELAAEVPRGRAISLATVSRRLAVDQDRAARMLRDARRSGVVLNSGNLWRRANWVIPLGVSHAFEAKTRDWRAGLDQAMRYARFFDFSSLVVLEMSDAGRREAIDRAARHGVGLFEGDQRLVAPTIRRLDAGRRLVTSEALLDSVAARAT